MKASVVVGLVPPSNSRAPEYLASKTQLWVAKRYDEADCTLSLKRQRRFAKYERELLRCGEELLALSRFANAQVVAFRKILKKYKVRVRCLENQGLGLTRDGHCRNGRDQVH